MFRSMPGQFTSPLTLNGPRAYCWMAWLAYPALMRSTNSIRRHPLFPTHPVNFNEKIHTNTTRVEDAAPCARDTKERTKRMKQKFPFPCSQPIFILICHRKGKESSFFAALRVASVVVVEARIPTGYSKRWTTFPLRWKKDLKLLCQRKGVFVFSSINPLFWLFFLSDDDDDYSRRQLVCACSCNCEGGGGTSPHLCSSLF